MIKDSDFIDCSAYIRVQEKRLITGAGFERIADASDPLEALRMLSQNSDYDFASLSRVQDSEQLLKRELRRVYDLAWSLTSHRGVVDLLACRYDYHNLKAALKAQYFPQRTAIPYVRVGLLSEEQLEKLPHAPDLPENLAEAVALAEAAFEKSGSPQDIDTVIDKAMFGHMRELAGELGNEFITEYVEKLIDFTNIKTLLRVREMQKGTAYLVEVLVDGGKTPVSFFLENYSRTPGAMAPVFYFRYFGEAMRVGVEAYERSGNFSVLERQLDNMLIESLKSVKYIAFGAPILFAYILSKENEIRQIRILLTCLRGGIGPEVLRERLRDNYA